MNIYVKYIRNTIILVIGKMYIFIKHYIHIFKVLNILQFSSLPMQ